MEHNDNVVINIYPDFDVNKFNEDQFAKNLEILVQQDVNNHIIIHVDCGDEDLELDSSEENAQINAKYVQAPGYTNFSQQILCVFQSYVIIQTPIPKKTLCYSCYYIHQLFLPESSFHQHVNTHIKRNLEHSNMDLHCFMCNKLLYQLVNPNVCLLCNKSQNTIEAYWDTIYYYVFNKIKSVI